jgi:predicted N-acetyltransferase YhbS
LTSILPLAEIDPQLVEALLDTAFGKDRHDRTAYRVREGMDMLEGLSLAAVDQERHELLGSIQCWPIALTDEEGKTHPMIMVGPVAVYPDFQREGIGRAMMAALLKEIHADDPLPLVMIGDPEYYSRFFDFTAEGTSGWTLPGPWEPSRLLARSNAKGDLPKTGALGPWKR